MRFNNSHQKNSYFNRREQFRLLFMVAALAVVLVSIRVAKTPATWQRLFPNESDQTKQSDQNKRTEQAADKQIDYNVVADDTLNLQPDEFRSQIAESQPVQSDTGPSVEPATRQQSQTDSAISQQDWVIEKTILATVRDNTLGIRNAESEAFYHVIEKLKKVNPATALASAVNKTNYTLLMTDSDRYRGHLVHVEGWLKRLTPIPVDKNATTVSDLYEAWVFTADSGKNPYRIICLQIPASVEPAVNLTRNVRIKTVGYFFKREGYAALGKSMSGKLHVAPLILARDFQLIQTRPVVTGTSDLKYYMIGFMVIIAVVIGLTIRSFITSDRKHGKRHQQLLRETLPEDIASLENLDHGSSYSIMDSIQREEENSDD